MVKMTEHERMKILGSVSNGEVTLPAKTIKKLIEDSRQCERLERRDVPSGDPANQVLKYLTDILFLSPKAANELCTFQTETTLGGKVSLLEMINGVLFSLGSDMEIKMERKHNMIMEFVLNRKVSR